MDSRLEQFEGGVRPSTLIEVRGGSFMMGDESAWAYPGDGEGPVHEVVAGAFAIDRYAVTNEAFGSFVEATGYVRMHSGTAGRSCSVGFCPMTSPPRGRWSARSGGVKCSGRTGGIRRDLTRQSRTGWIIRSCTCPGRMRRRFCAWSGTRLPTEAEWEYAARAGTSSPFPWGDELEPGGAHRMNVFQGRFPNHNTMADGFAGTAPVDAFAPNEFGLYNVTGNVWEWCADWYDPGYYARSPLRIPRGPGRGNAPRDAGWVVPVPQLVLSAISRFGPAGQRAGVVDG